MGALENSRGRISVAGGAVAGSLLDFVIMCMQFIDAVTVYLCLAGNRLPKDFYLVFGFIRTIHLLLHEVFVRCCRQERFEAVIRLQVVPCSVFIDHSSQGVSPLVSYIIGIISSFTFPLTPTIT